MFPVESALKVFAAIFWIGGLVLVSYPLGAGELFFDSEDYQRTIEDKMLFSFDEDRDNNRFPDDWFLQRSNDPLGRRYDDYHSVLTDVRVGHGDEKSLHFVFSGGRAGVHSATLKLNPRYAYRMTLIRRGINLDRARGNWLRYGLFAYDKDEKVLGHFESQVSGFSPQWERTPELRIEQLPAGTYSCTLFVSIEGSVHGRSELWIDDVQLQASARIHLETGRDLNIYEKGEDMVFVQKVGGTQPGASYQLKTVVRDFLGQVIDSDTRTLKGSNTVLEESFRVPITDAEITGVYSIDTTLEQGGEKIVTSQELIARDAPQASGLQDPTFGVLLGYPRPPFKDLIHSLKKLRVSISKLDLLAPEFKFSDFMRDGELPELKPLLEKLAPDEGYQFIGVLNRIPADTLQHEKFIFNPAVHVSETFATHPDAWNGMLGKLLLLYGSVIGHWQIGDDHVDLKPEWVSQGNQVLSFLKNKAQWSEVLLPSSWQNEQPSATVYIPSEVGLAELESLLQSRKSAGLHATLQLGSKDQSKAIEILEDLVKKVTLLKASRDPAGNPLVARIFVDRLNAPDRGLMTMDYKPQTPFFAVKTLVSWFQGSEYLGRFTLDDPKIVNHVFLKGDEAFAIFWRSEKSTVKLYLSDHVERMDLMGNRKELLADGDKSISVELSSTPVFLISPYPELVRTMLSYRLGQPHLRAEVILQDQQVSLVNHFSENALFRFDIHYPEDWLNQGRVREQELTPGENFTHALRLSPSSLSASGPVKVYTDLEITLEKRHHLVRLYREDELMSDVTVDCTFFRDAIGLKMDIHLNLSQAAPRNSSFIVSASFPDGKNIETFFKDVRPGENSRQSLLVRGGLTHVGKDVTVQIKEDFGDRYINRAFPIVLKY